MILEVNTENQTQKISHVLYYLCSRRAATVIFMLSVFTLWAVLDQSLQAITKRSQLKLTRALVPPNPKKSFSAFVFEKNQFKPHWIHVEVQAGDSLARIFSRQGISALTLQSILRNKRASLPLKRLKPGQQIQYLLDDQAKLKILKLTQGATDSITITQENDGFTFKRQALSYQKRLAFTHATIEDSLFIAGKKAGLSDKQLMQLEDIFAWDIDFLLDIRKGDQISLVYEALYLDGEKKGSGDILAVELMSRNKTYLAIRFVDPQGQSAYFTPQGLSMRKAFRRVPLKYSRISDHFNLRRKHPILNSIRAHKGVDYAAPRGTPVYAAGDGRISFAARKGSFGKLIVIHHNSQYSTKYAHLSRYVRGLHKGKKVRQGDLIGYVGSTGGATGPHLHYEFLVKGHHRNPRTVKLPKALPINKRYIAEFTELSNKQMKLLDLFRPSLLAQKG